MKYFDLVFKALGYSCFNFSNVMKSEAVRYANEFYYKAFNSGAPELVQEYKSWVSSILYYQRCVPHATYFPKDMYEHIVTRLGLSSMPVSEDSLENFLHNRRTVVRKQIAGVLSTIPSIGSIHFCYKQPARDSNPFRQQTVRSAAILSEVPTGYLLLYSWGTLRDYQYTDSHVIENQILNKKLKGIYLSAISNN